MAFENFQTDAKKATDSMRTPSSEPSQYEHDIKKVPQLATMKRFVIPLLHTK